MERIEQSVEYYDRMFQEGGYEGVYDLPYGHSAYFPLFRSVLAEVRRRGARSILEVGCGTGGFAHLTMDTTDLAYSGFDFSPVAVERAGRRTGREWCFYVGDATRAESYPQSYDAIVCTEVLEHIDDDLTVIGNWRTGCACVCSVPNFDAESHVRFFRHEHEVHGRYDRSIAIDKLVRIKKPVLSDISWRSYARALRWNRYRPRQLLAVLGFGSFDSLGGWFLFSGRKR